MSFRKLGAIVLIGGAILVLFRDYIFTLIFIFIILTILIVLIRLLADLYWHGKDKGEW